MVVPQESQCGEDRELETSEGFRQPTLSLLSNCCEELQRMIRALAVLTEIVSVITTLVDADVDTGILPTEDTIGDRRRLRTSPCTSPLHWRSARSPVECLIWSDLTVSFKNFAHGNAHIHTHLLALTQCYVLLVSPTRIPQSHCCCLSVWFYEQRRYPSDPPQCVLITTTMTGSISATQAATIDIDGRQVIAIRLHLLQKHTELHVNHLSVTVHFDTPVFDMTVGVRGAVKVVARNFIAVWSRRHSCRCHASLL